MNKDQIWKLLSINFKRKKETIIPTQRKFQGLESRVYYLIILSISMEKHLVRLLVSYIKEL